LGSPTVRKRTSCSTPATPLARSTNGEPTWPGASARAGGYEPAPPARAESGAVKGRLRWTTSPGGG
jgi:hypothetical protein